MLVPHKFAIITECGDFCVLFFSKKVVFLFCVVFCFVMLSQTQNQI